MLKICNFPRHASFCVTYATRVQYHCKAKLFIGYNYQTNKCTYIKFHIKTFKIAPTYFDPKNAPDYGCATHTHSQAHSQQRTLTQHDMLPQHPINIRELISEWF